MHPKRFISLAFSLAASLALVFSHSGLASYNPQERNSAAPNADYFVFQQTTGGKILPVYYRPVRLAAKLQSLDPIALYQNLASPERNARRLVVTLQNPDGSTAYRSILELPSWLRGEFQGKPGLNAIDSHLFPLEDAAFVVRVPRIPGASLALADSNLVELARFNLEGLETGTRQLEPALPAPVIGSLNSPGNPANRVDLLIMGDGYTAAQQAKFISDAAAMSASFLDISPVSAYANYFNITTLFTPSLQSGADHPPYVSGCSPYDLNCCGDAEMLSDPLQGTFVNTAFDSTFCSYNIHRLLVVPGLSKVWAAASAVPDWDKIILMVNDSTYGGSGGQLIVTSTHSASVSIAQHEFGHNFSDLADEYDAPYPGYPTCSDLGGFSPCEANVTDQTVRASIKWAPWILPTTPIPTTPEYDPQYSSVVGLFEGARYMTTGMYRAGQTCLMQVLGAPYCQVPAQAFVLRLYQGGWSQVNGGINMIEPGTALPAGPLTLAYPRVQTFQAGILQPVLGPPAPIEWYVNGIKVPGETASSFAYATSLAQLGNVTIEMRVKDATSFVHPAMAGSWLGFSHTWQVYVAQYGIFLPVLLR